MVKIECPYFEGEKITYCGDSLSLVMPRVIEDTEMFCRIKEYSSCPVFYKHSLIVHKNEGKPSVEKSLKSMLEN